MRHHKRLSGDMAIPVALVGRPRARRPKRLFADQPCVVAATLGDSILMFLAPAAPGNSPLGCPTRWKTANPGFGGWAIRNEMYRPQAPPSAI